jgi:uncharacterized membrane protein SirB2
MLLLLFYITLFITDTMWHRSNLLRKLPMMNDNLLVLTGFFELKKEELTDHVQYVNMTYYIIQVFFHYWSIFLATSVLYVDCYNTYIKI